MDLETELAAQQERVVALEAELAEALDEALAAAQVAADRIGTLETAQSEAEQRFMAEQAEAAEMIAAEELKVTNLQSELETAQGNLETARTNYEMVVVEKEAAEDLATGRAIELANQALALGNMIADYKAQVTVLTNNLTGAQGALAEAKGERDKAIAARDEAVQLAATEQSTVEAQLVVARQEITSLQGQLQAAQARLDGAGAERDAIADERDAALERADRADARDALGGTYSVGDIEAIVRYRESATVTAAPVPPDSPTFASVSTSTTGQWFKTTLSNRGSMTAEQAEIYSDVDAPDNILFADSELNTAFDNNEIVMRDWTEITDGKVVDSTGKVIGWIPVATLNHERRDPYASAFPRTSASGRPMQIKLTDRGEYTDRAILAENIKMDKDARDLAEAAMTEYTNVYDSRGYTIGRAQRIRDPVRYPEEYSVEVSGRLDNAGGKFVCGGDAPDTTCTVQNTGAGFFFVGDWRFQPSSSSRRVRVPDEHYMWFGWWSQRPISDPDGPFAFRANHGGVAPPVTTVAGVTGAATYVGVASGQYAIYQTLGTQSSHGRFDAKATLIADFDANSVSGTITKFSQQPDWSLTLESQDISNGTIGDAGNENSNGTVSWLIGGIPQDSTADVDQRRWEAKFYSDIDFEGLSTGSGGAVERVRPYGIAGAFIAVYSEPAPMADPEDPNTVGRMVGAFGAHVQ